MNKSFWLIVGTLVLSPVILNFTIFQFNTPWTYGNGETWLTFWGNYSGGLISAFVAYFIANSQIKKQLRIDLAQKKHDRMIAQLPSLFRLQFELETYIIQLKNVVEERNHLILKAGGIIPDEEYDPNKVMAGIKEYNLDIQKYKIESLNHEVYQLLEKIENDDLHIKLLTCFKFYERFSKAVSYDNDATNRKVEEIMNWFIVNAEPYTESALVEERHLQMEADEYYLLKRKVWKEIEEEIAVKDFEDAFESVQKEIYEVQEIKNSIL
jgi:hypothetical protein